MTPFPFVIQTPTGPLGAGDALFVGVRAEGGSLGVLARHAPMIAACPPGVVRVQRAAGWSYYATSEAILRTDGHDTVVLTGRAEEAPDEVAALALVHSGAQTEEA